MTQVESQERRAKPSFRLSALGSPRRAPLALPGGRPVNVVAVTSQILPAQQFKDTRLSLRDIAVIAP